MDPDINTVTLPVILSKVINFTATFSGLPVVVVWLTGLSSTTGAVVSVEATATKITTTQFTVQIDSGSGEHLLSVGAAWVAWERDAMIAIGSVSLPMPSYASHKLFDTAWTIQLAAVRRVELGLEQDALVQLVFFVNELARDTKRWRLCSGHETSATVVFVMDCNELAVWR